MSLTLTVVLLNKHSPFHWACQHVCGFVKDTQTGRSFSLNFSAWKDQLDNVVHPAGEKGIIERTVDSDDCCLGVAKLYSNKNFDEFVESYRERFCKIEEYGCCSKNCADAIDFAINELCPGKAKSEIISNIYKILCCLFFFLTCGMSCLPAPPCSCNTPKQLFDKAEWLADNTSYGHKPIAPPVPSSAIDSEYKVVGPSPCPAPYRPA